MSFERDIQSLGWSVSLDESAGELHLDHADADASVVLGADGDLRVSGDGTGGADLRALQAALTDASEHETAAGADGTANGEDETAAGADGTTDGGHEAVTTDNGTGADADPQVSNCPITCQGSSVRIQPTGLLELSAGRIRLDANVVELDGDRTTISSSGPLSLDGAVIELN